MVDKKVKIWVGPALLPADLLKDIAVWESEEEERSQYSGKGVWGLSWR